MNLVSLKLDKKKQHFEKMALCLHVFYYSTLISASCFKCAIEINPYLIIVGSQNKEQIILITQPWGLNHL